MKWYRFHTLLFIAFLIGTFCDQSQSWISNCKLEYDALQCDRIGKLDLWSLGRPSAESKWSALPEPKLIISPCLSSSTISTFSTTEHHWLRSGVRGKHCKRFEPKTSHPTLDLHQSIFCCWTSLTSLARWMHGETFQMVRTVRAKTDPTPHSSVWTIAIIWHMMGSSGRRMGF